MIKKRLLILFLVAAMLVCTFVAALGSEKPVWVEAEGEAYLSDIDTPKEVMQRARRDAQNRAVEKGVGTFVRSHTLVSNSQLAEDLVYASVRGKVANIKIKQEGWDRQDRNLYRVKLRALVEPVYPERGGSMSLKLSLSKSELKEGDEIKILYQASENCYVYMFSIAADGSVTLLLPNSANMDNAAERGKAYEFPSSGGPVRLKAMFLPGFKGEIADERVKVIATRKREDIVPLGFREGIFKVYDSKSTGMISDLVKKLNQLDPADWTEATAVYRIQR